MAGLGDVSFYAIFAKGTEPDGEAVQKAAVLTHLSSVVRRYQQIPHKRPFSKFSIAKNIVKSV
jgi:hypothetical protein